MNRVVVPTPTVCRQSGLCQAAILHRVVINCLNRSRWFLTLFYFLFLNPLHPLYTSTQNTVYISNQKALFSRHYSQFKGMKMTLDQLNGRKFELKEIMNKGKHVSYMSITSAEYNSLKVEREWIFL